MRELKFRAWIEDCDAKIPYALYFDLESISQGSIMARDSEWHRMFDLKDTTEQYTGLKDKNGMEIYEGDIVSRNVPRARAGAIQFAQGIFGINWDYGQNPDPLWLEGTMYGSWNGKHNLRSVDDGFMSENMEVIGNIHENPEILK